MTNKRTKFFTWWHRDEVQVVFVYALVTIFFSRSWWLQATLLAASIFLLGSFWLVRIWKRVEQYEEGSSVNRLLLWMHSLVPPFPWERSRLILSISSTLIVGALFLHRWLLYVRDAGEPASKEGSFATPLDLYWILILGLYLVIWIVISVFLLYKWKRNALPTEHAFWEGLVGSMFFFHGLPSKARVVTFGAAFLLGGVPTALATRIRPSDPSGHLWALILMIPVVVLIILGAWFAARWVGTTPSGEV